MALLLSFRPAIPGIPTARARDDRRRHAADEASTSGRDQGAAPIASPDRHLRQDQDEARADGPDAAVPRRVLGAGREEFDRRPHAEPLGREEEEEEALLVGQLLKNSMHTRVERLE